MSVTCRLDEINKSTRQIYELMPSVPGDFRLAVLVDVQSVKGDPFQRMRSLGEQMPAPWTASRGIHEPEEVFPKGDRSSSFVVECPTRMGTPEVGGGSVDRKIRQSNHAMPVCSIHQLANRGKGHLAPERINIVLRGGHELVVAILPVVELKAVDVKTRQCF